MMKRMCLGLIGLSMIGGLRAGNLLKNADFSEKSQVGLPLHWEFRGPNLEGCKVKENAIKLGGGKEGGDGIFLVQHHLPLADGIKYKLSFKVRSAINSEYRVYCEWTRANEGKRDWLGTSASFCRGTTEWESREVVFEYGGAGEKLESHLAIHVKEDGEAEFKDLALEPCEAKLPDNTKLTDSASLLSNGDFVKRDANNRPLSWEARGGDESFSYRDGGAMLKGTSGKDLTLIQRNPPLQAGVSYEVLYEVKGGLKRGEYRVYFEAIQVIDGKDVWKSFATGWLKTPGQCEVNGFNFSFPEKVRSSHLVIQVKAGDDAEFRNITLKAVDETKGKKQFGGIWQLYGGSKFIQDNSKDLLMVKMNPAGARLGGAILKGVPLEVGKQYTFSYSVRGEGKAGNDTGYHPFQISVEFAGLKEKAESPWDDTWNSSFQNKQFTFTVPIKADSGKVDIRCVVLSKGGILFDRFTLVEAKENPAEKYTIALDRPAYRNMIFPSMPVPEIVGSVVTDSSISRVNLTLKNGSKIIHSAKLDGKGDRTHFKIPAVDLPVGKYVLTAELANKTGVVATPHLVIEKLKPAMMEVVQGQDRNFYINGKVFFPIMFWHVVSLGQDEETPLYYAARQGVNLTIRIVSDETTALQVLNTLGKYGMKVVLSMGFAENCEGDMLKLWTHRISNVLTPAVVNHPALLGYFLEDEPSWGGIPLKNLLSSYQVFKDLDPYHPVWINAAPRGAIEEHQLYSQAADIYGVDIYPVPYPAHHSGLEDKGLTSVGKYAQRMYEAVDGRKAIWMALQGFSWQQSQVKAADHKDIGYPTYVESRFMAYDALINHANSVGYWGMYTVLMPSFYDVLFSLTTELQEMSGLLMQGKIVDDVTSENHSIKCRALDFNGKKYLIALNNSDQAITSEISGKFAGPELRVFKENRTVAFGNGRFSDGFKPFEVHVYGEAELPPPVNTLPPPNPELDKKGNPFHQYIERQLHAVMYDGKANWIWEKDNVAVVSSKVWLGKEFVIDKPVKSALLLISADDLGAAYFNGQLLGKIDGCLLMKKFDIAKMVRQGSNLLSVAAADGGRLPCGVLADLEIETSDGEIISILSDGTWQASAKETADWLTPAAVRKWSTAAIVAPYGTGNWGKRVQLPQD